LMEDERAKAVRRIKVRNHNSSYTLGLSVNDEGKPNGSREQTIQKGTVSIVRFRDCMIVSLL
jgi:hypothetical protein